MIFDNFCGMIFPDIYKRHKILRVGKDFYTVIFRIGKWHLLKKYY